MAGVGAFESRNFPSLFEWSELQNSDERNLINCANSICRLILEYKDLIRSYRSLQSKLDESNEKYGQLCKERERPKNCENCGALQTRIRIQNSTIRTIADIFQQIAVNSSLYDNTPLQRARDIFTQLGIDCAQPEFSRIDTGETKVEFRDATNDRNIFVTNRIELNNESDINTTPPKQSYSAVESRPSSLSDIDASNQVSPVLKKSKMHRKTLKNQKTPAKLFSDSFVQDNCSKIISTDKIENDSPSVFSLGDKKIKISELNNFVGVSPNKIKYNKENSPECSKYSNKNIPKCPNKSKNLKQGRLVFTKPKPKITLDVSHITSFGGGVRNSPTYMQVKNNDSEDILNEVHNQNIKQEISDEIDEINESPSCINKYSYRKNNFKYCQEEKIHKNIKKEVPLLIDESTFCIIEDAEKSLSLESENLDNKIKKLSPKSSDLSGFKKPVPEYIYKEDPVRKKSEKNKLPGWSCTKCNDFYNVAFKGNEELIKQKLNECSKHRGKFNPERSKTPPGFWDMNMPPTQDTETFNRRNNQT